MMFGREKERDDKISLSGYTISTIVGMDTVIEGDIKTDSSVRIEGELIGNVSTKGVVVLSQCGKIKGSVVAENIIVAGIVEGNLNIADKVNIEPTGEVYGDIITKRLLIDEESIFQGKCTMNRDKSKALSVEEMSDEEEKKAAFTKQKAVKTGEEEPERREAVREEPLKEKTSKEKAVKEKAVKEGTVKEETKKDKDSKQETEKKEDANEETAGIKETDEQEKEKGSGEEEDIEYVDVNVKHSKTKRMNLRERNTHR